MEYMSRLFGSPTERNVAAIVATSVISTALLLNLLRLGFQDKREKIIRSPTVTLLPTLSASEIAALPYPPDALPGGRDVGTPYGTVRVYEWGSEDGRKILFTHGMTTPCLAVGGVAHGLANNGCRVMVMDLWGRGYNDTPGDLDHDERLYSTQILLAVTSSPLPWIGGLDGGFSIIGYSMGGGVAAVFTSYFPNMVKSLVLLAPGGLIRSARMEGRTKSIYSNSFVPERLLQWIIKRRLENPPVNPDDIRNADDRDKEVRGGAEFYYHDASLSKTRPDVTVTSVVGWQVRVHQGFVKSFMSSMRFAPVTGMNTAWKQLGLRSDQIMIVTGISDFIIVRKELIEDAEEALGAGKIVWREVEGAHDFPITNADEVVGQICEFWGIRKIHKD